MDSRHRKVPAIWNLASDAGYNVGVVGWLGTWPPESINGTIVSNYFFMPQNAVDVTAILDPGLRAIHPAEAALDIAPLLVSTGQISVRTLQKERLAAMAAYPMTLAVLSKDLSFHNCAKWLLAHRQPDLLMVYFQGTDVLCHTLWPYTEYALANSGGPPTRYRFRPGSDDALLSPDDLPQEALPDDQHRRLMQKGQILLNYYQMIDRRVGELLETTAPSSGRFVCVVSDHGYGPHSGEVLTQTGDQYYSRPTHWHLLHGILILNGPGIKPKTEVKGSGVEDIFPTLMTVLGLPLSRQLAGKPIWDAFETEWRDAHPAVHIDAYTSEAASESTATMSSEAEAELLRQLRSLGYIR